jgi:hypothetical protein
MWGDAAYGEAAYGEPQDNTISAFQNRDVFAEISFIAAGVGALVDTADGVTELTFVAGAIGVADRTKVRVIQTAPHTRRGKTGLSHTGLNNESV